MQVGNVLTINEMKHSVSIEDTGGKHVQSSSVKTRWKYPSVSEIFLLKIIIYLSTTVSREDARKYKL